MGFVQELDVPCDGQRDLQIGVEQRARVDAETLLGFDIFGDAWLRADAWQHDQPDEPDCQSCNGQPQPTPWCCFGSNA